MPTVPKQYTKSGPVGCLSVFTLFGQLWCAVAMCVFQWFPMKRWMYTCFLNSCIFLFVGINPNLVSLRNRTAPTNIACYNGAVAAIKIMIVEVSCINAHSLQHFVWILHFRYAFFTQKQKYETANNKKNKPGEKHLLKFDAIALLPCFGVVYR